LSVDSSDAIKFIAPGSPVNCWCQQPAMLDAVSAGKLAAPKVVSCGAQARNEKSARRAAPTGYARLSRGARVERKP